jgi:hypothetical protein
LVTVWVLLYLMGYYLGEVGTLPDGGLSSRLGFALRLEPASAAPRFPCGRIRAGDAWRHSEVG